MTSKRIFLEMKSPKNLGVSKIHSQTDKNRLYRGFLETLVTHVPHKWDGCDSGLLWMYKERCPRVHSLWREGES